MLLVLTNIAATAMDAAMPPGMIFAASGMQADGPSRRSSRAFLGAVSPRMTEQPRRKHASIQSSSRALSYDCRSTETSIGSSTTEIQESLAQSVGGSRTSDWTKQSDRQVPGWRSGWPRFLSSRHPATDHQRVSATSNLAAPGKLRNDGS